MKKRLDEQINKIKNIMGISELITEVSKKDILINKLGLDEDNAEYLDRICGPLSVIIANKIIDRYRGGYSDKDTMEHLNNFGVDRLYGTEITSIMDWVRVGLNGNLSEYKNLTLDQLKNKSEEWHDSLQIGQGEINYVENHPIVIDFRKEDGTGFYWVNLETNESDEECDRMGHCGRTGKGNNLFSLRETIKLPGGKYTLNRSHLTASISDEGILYQLKGSKNSKPKSEFHQYIVPLFFMIGGGGEEHDYYINGFGSEYASNLDFKLSDLPEESIKVLYRDRPELFSGYGMQKLLIKMGIIENKTSSVFELELETDEIGDYINGDYVISTRKWVDDNGNKRTSSNYLFKTIMEDPWDLWENYDVDWKSSLQYHVNDKNEAKIREILSKDTEEDTSEYSIEDLIEEFDGGEIVSAISSATSDGERDSYGNMLRDTLKSCLEEYGKVTKFDDEGVKVTIDLDNFTDNVDEEDLNEFFENCKDEPSCVFYDIMNGSGYGGYVDKPKFSVDDRWYPDINETYFNEYLSERLSEI
jgi:hypothetical protein